LSFAASVKSQEPGKNLLSPELGREAIEWAKQKIAVWGGSITTYFSTDPLCGRFISRNNSTGQKSGWRRS